MSILTDLTDKLNRASAELTRIAARRTAYTSDGIKRIRAKRSGIELALSYVNDAIRLRDEEHELTAALRGAAAEIRAELVCCDTYEQNHATGKYQRYPRDHDICYWGEAAAQLVEARAKQLEEN